MSNVQIPNLPAVASLSGDELFEGVQAGSSVKISLGQMIAAARTGIPTTVPLPVSAGGTGVTTSTGTGSVVLSDNPTLVGPSIDVGTFGLGTVGAPSITFTGDANTGIWSPGANLIAVSTNGAERMRISSIGNVGIGTTSPGVLFDVNGRARVQDLWFASTSGQIEARAGNTPTFMDTDFPEATSSVVSARFFRNTSTSGGASVRFHRADGTATEDARIGVGAVDTFFSVGGGEFGIGTATPIVKLDVLGDGLVIRAQSTTSTDAYMRFDGTGTSFPFIGLVAGIGTFGNTDASPIRFNTNTVERMRIHATGGVSIGNTTDPGATNLLVSGSIRSSGAGGIGYSTGAGVAVTQPTSRTTPVPTTGNKTSGAITLFTAAPTVGAWFSFTVPNTAIAVTDTVSLTVRGATNSYLACVTAIAPGTSFTVSMASLVGTASDTPIVNFNIIRGVSA